MLIALQEVPPSVMPEQCIIYPIIAPRVCDYVRDHISEKKIIKEQTSFKEASLISMASLLCEAQTEVATDTDDLHV